MTVKKCPECNGDVSTKAKACPHCGASARGWHQELCRGAGRTRVALSQNATPRGMAPRWLMPISATARPVMNPFHGIGRPQHAWRDRANAGRVAQSAWRQRRVYLAADDGEHRGHDRFQRQIRYQSAMVDRQQFLHAELRAASYRW